MKTKIRLIDSDNRIIDKFSVNRSIENAIDKLRELYIGHAEVNNGVVDFYIDRVKGRK